MYRYIVLFLMFVFCAPMVAHAVSPPLSIPSSQIGKIEEMDKAKTKIIINKVEYKITTRTSVKGPAGKKLERDYLTNGTRVRYEVENSAEALDPLTLKAITVIVD